MKLIVTHEQPDFDALASLALAKLLHPEAEVAVHGGIPASLQPVLHLYRDVIEVRDAGDIDLDAVTELVVVDTSEAERIRPFDRLVASVPVTLYDHHPVQEDGIPAGRGIVERVGATATLLTRALKAQNREIPAPIASLALLGIHEDTGSLSYRLTSPDDYEAAAHLLRCGANLELVRRHARDRFGEEHLVFRRHMMDAAETRRVSGHEVVTVAMRHPTYLPGVSGLVNELLDAHRAEAAVLCVTMEDRGFVVARSGGAIDVGAALEEALDGGGHPGAAFARTDLAPEAALARVLEVLPRVTRPSLRGTDLMSTPVKTVEASATVAEAQALLASFGHNGVPVMEEGELVGILSRRDLERALRHGLGRTEIRGFMTRDVITAEESASLAELERLVETHNIGRIPILRDGRLVGIVTRSDLLAARHQGPSGPDPAARVLERLPGRVHEVLDAAASVLEGGALYLVGGTVRDAYLGTGMTDLDVAVEGMAVDLLGSRLQALLGGTLSCHVAFGTCTLRLASGLVVDLAATREETYAHPGALPDVTPSTVRKDLARRDFSVNALAIRIHPGPPELRDPYGGLDDLARRRLRVLHPLSFVEDPTRIVRGARLAGRLGFELDGDTRDRAEAALVPEVLGPASRSRLRSELELTLAEPRVDPALRILQELGALQAMYGLSLEPAPTGGLDELRQAGVEVPDEAYLLALLLSLESVELPAFLERFHLPRRLAESARLLRATVERGEATEEDLEALGPAGRAVLKAFGEDLAAHARSFEQVPQRRKLRGRDVIDLGLPEGPEVGEILRAVSEARSRGQVTTFGEELDLARRLVRDRRAVDRE